MTTVTKERPQTVKEVSQRHKAAAVQPTKQLEQRVSPLTVISADAAAQPIDAHRDQPLGAFSKLARGLRDVFFQLGISGPSNLYYEDGRGFPPRNENLRHAQPMGVMLLSPTSPTGSGLNHGLNHREPLLRGRARVSAQKRESAARPTYGGYAPIANVAYRQWSESRAKSSRRLNRRA